jgi:hypothetical protein
VGIVASLGRRYVVFSRGDPELDRELQSEIGQRSRWRRDVLLFLGGILTLLAIVLLIGVMTPAPDTSSVPYEGLYIAIYRG